MPSPNSTRRARRNKKRWHMVQSLFFIFVFALAAFFFLQSSYFSVRNIEVSGNKQLTREKVITLSGLTKGVNIFKANLNQARDKVALDPMVQQVDITRKLPATVLISLSERKAIGLIADRGAFQVISEDGCLLAKVSSLSTLNLPFLTGTKPVSTGPGQKIQDEKLKTGLAYLLAMPLSVRAAVSEINVSDLNNIRMYTIDRVEVRFGDDGRIPDKIKLYQEVISRKYQDKIQYVDISYKGNPVIKFTPSEQQVPKQEP